MYLDSNNLKIELQELDSINKEYVGNPVNENSKNETIIDIKNTKSHILFLTGITSKILSFLSYYLDQHKLSIMQVLQMKQESEKLQFSFISRDFFPGQKIIKISCGSSHVLALSDKGTVYSWGSNSNGRLGQGKKEDISEPTLVKQKIVIFFI